MLVFDIAKRYLFAKKSNNIINIITGISILGISIGTAALILIVSVFNGFEDLLSNMLNNFNPDIKVTPIEGKFFEISDEELFQLKSINGVNGVSKVIEEIALFEYNDAHEIGTLKGVDDSFSKVVSIDSTMVFGDFILKEGAADFLVFGLGMQSKLGLNIKDPLANITVYVPLKKGKSALGQDFVTNSAYPSGSFSITGEADYSTVISSFDFASKLIKADNKISQLEIRIDPEIKTSKVVDELEKFLGPDYEIKNRYQQEAAFLKLMNIEKWVSFLIGCLMLFLITFNLAGLLWVVVLDKKKDISILKSMGMISEDIKKIFLLEGMMIAGVGCLIGIALALIIYYLQVNYSLLSISSGLVEAYPIKLKLQDFFIVTGTLMLLAYLSSILPARRAANTTAFVREE